MNFEWDPAKRASNLRKHGIAFENAIGIFEGPYLEGPDDRDGYGEERTIAIGETRGVVMVIVYTWRNENRRIISARKATKQEREASIFQISSGRPS